MGVEGEGAQGEKVGERSGGADEERWSGYRITHDGP